MKIFISPHKVNKFFQPKQVIYLRPIKAGFYVAFGIMMLLLLWKAIALATNSEVLMPPPESTFYRLFQMLPQASFWRALGATALRSVYGFAISFFAAIGVGILAGIWRPFRQSVMPLLTTLRVMPLMSVILLGMLWFVTDLVPVFVTFLMVFPLVCASILEGMAQIDGKLLEMGRIYRLGRWSQFVHILLPSLLPFILAAANAGLGMAWKVTIAAEVLCQPRNAVGTGIRYAQLNLETPDVMAWTTAAVLLSALTESLLGMLNRFFPWRRDSL